MYKGMFNFLAGYKTDTRVKNVFCNRMPILKITQLSQLFKDVVCLTLLEK